MRTVKRCSRCRSYLPLDQFGVLSRSPDGRSHKCLECERLRQRQRWRQQQPLLAQERRLVTDAIGRLAPLTDDERRQQERRLRLVSLEQLRQLAPAGYVLRCAACRGRLIADRVELGRVELVCQMCCRVVLTVEGEGDRTARLNKERALAELKANPPKRGRPAGKRRVA